MHNCIGGKQLVKIYGNLFGASLVALASTLTAAPAFAQSTGSIETEETIIVMGARVTDGIGGVVAPETTKAKAVLTQELIERQNPGQTILNAINMVPGVNFTNSDAYGSSGGNLRIRGFDGNRISLTLDGMPLNDTGNYAIFSNQQLDPELIDQVNVNLGATDVDSPTASASGGTVNYRTRLPKDDLGAVLSASYGEDDFHRVFGAIDTGVFTSFGTKAFFSASMARNDKFKGPGKIDKQQYNARIYQPIGDNGDFISIAGHYNENRNTFYRAPNLSEIRTLTGETLPAGINNTALIGDFSGAQEDAIMAFDYDATCTVPTPVAGTAQAASTCSNYHGVRINPSNTGNVRFNSRFTLTENLMFTVDGAFQYVLANGGGSTALAENSAQLIGSSSALGVDLNGDSDILDTVRVYTPNNTNTRRYLATASLIWDVTENHRLRLAYSFDRGRHRQTGEFGFLNASGNPLDVFGGRNEPGVISADGAQLQQRDRLSIALLHQVAGEYVGKFMDERLTVQAGIRAPFFKRKLDQHCYTMPANGFAYCSTQPASTVDPTFARPFEKTYKYDKLLPNAGFNYKFTDQASIFGSYAKGFSAPRTDNLYRAAVVDVQPETTDSFDLGVRYSSSRIQAQLTGWVINYKNRIVSSFDRDLGISLDRNVGKVDSYGFDGSIAWRPIDQVTLYAFGSYTHAELKDNIEVSSTQILPTKGKLVPETPEWQLGGRAEFTAGPVSLGLQGKWVDDRYATDLNDVLVKGYTLVDLDARLSLAQWGLDKTYFQLNVTNLFDEFYFGSFMTQVQGSNGPNFTVGAPRTVMGTVHFEF